MYASHLPSGRPCPVSSGAISRAALVDGTNRTRLAMSTINKEPERHEIEALLPWHAAGTLSRRDADRVEQALADDRELARRYDLVREELAETIYLNETLSAPSARAMEEAVRRDRCRGGTCAAPPPAPHQPSAIAG